MPSVRSFSRSSTPQQSRRSARRSTAAVSLHLRDLAFSYCDFVDVFRDISMDLAAGWTGVVGANGSGKSTLLQLTTGSLVPTVGSIAKTPSDALVHLCPQRVDACNDEMMAFANSWSRSDIRLRARLELDPEELMRWTNLSPGERKRWQIATALALRPDILLLDEPSNHLDAHARQLLLHALSNFRGLGLLVSHDRHLLDTLTQSTVRILHGSAHIYKGNYSQAYASWRQEEQAKQQAHAAASRQERAMRRRLDDARRRRASAAANISARNRVKGSKDSDGRSVNAKNRAMSGEARQARQVAIARGKLDRARVHLSAIELVKERGGNLFIDYEPASRRTLMALDGVDLYAGDTCIASAITVAVGAKSRICLDGRNGAGKTTLLKALLDACTCRDRILYLPQIIAAKDAEALLHHIRTLAPKARGRVLQVAAALGLDPDRVLGTQAPSPGEIRKLMIARGLGMGAWALVLDEPTNHLDLPSIERLQAALSEYPGALLLVSHDQVFAHTLTDTSWHLNDGAIEIDTIARDFSAITQG